MEKISRIIPESSRQVWQSGEVAKPRRVSDPTPDDGFSSIRQKAPEMLSQAEDVAGTAPVQGFAHKGSKLNMTA